MDTKCPACGAVTSNPFYTVDQVPANSVVLLDSKEDAASFPAGDIELHLCEHCGFVFNGTFDPDIVEYSGRYEETQGYSETFRQFHERLAEDLIERYALEGADIVEIGCGKGEFLDLLCRKSGARGIGFDPAFVSERSRVEEMSDRIEIVPEYFRAELLDRIPDFVCCKMTLEHIPDVRPFLDQVYKSVRGSDDSQVFIQVPETLRILNESAYWDVYYEHCSYFTIASLRRLFERVGFRVEDAWTDYGGQYLMMVARPAGAETHADGSGGSERAGGGIEEQVRRFSDTVDRARKRWDARVERSRRKGERLVLWGGGSKAVAFLSALRDPESVEAVVDINPHKHGTYLPGSGHEVVSPRVLSDIAPDRVVVMNPMYEKEIRTELRAQGLDPTVMTVVD